MTLCDQPVSRKPQKRFKLESRGLRSAQTENFTKLKNLGTPKLCWADQVKFEFWGHLEVKKGQKRKSLKIGEFFLVLFDSPLKLCQSLKIFCNSSPQVVELSLFLF